MISQVLLQKIALLSLTFGLVILFVGTIIPLAWERKWIENSVFVLAMTCALIACCSVIYGVWTF